MKEFALATDGSGQSGTVAGEAGDPPKRPSLLERLLASRWSLVAMYVFFLGAYLGASGGRLRQHSQYNHFVYLAEGWLKGRLDMP
ncbi:MAG TPA: hypothetical protein VIM14_18435, partial [Polyangia bacterium]